MLRVVAVLALVTLVSAPLSGQTDEQPDAAPLFVLPNLDGAEVALADYLGRVIILDLWASWCPPCTRAFPDIHALQEAYADQGVVLLVISFDKNEDEAREYLVENGFETDNVLWGSLEEARAVRDLYGVDTVTHTFVIDRDGYIRFSGHPAALTAAALEPLL